MWWWRPHHLKAILTSKKNVQCSQVNHEHIRMCEEDSPTGPNLTQAQNDKGSLFPVNWHVWGFAGQWLSTGAKAPQRTPPTSCLSVLDKGRSYSTFSTYMSRWADIHSALSQCNKRFSCPLSQKSEVVMDNYIHYDGSKGPLNRLPWPPTKAYMTSR